MTKYEVCLILTNQINRFSAQLLGLGEKKSDYLALKLNSTKTGSSKSDTDSSFCDTLWYLFFYVLHHQDVLQDQVVFLKNGCNFSKLKMVVKWAPFLALQNSGPFAGDHSSPLNFLCLLVIFYVTSISSFKTSTKVVVPRGHCPPAPSHLTFSSFSCWIRR